MLTSQSSAGPPFEPCGAECGGNESFRVQLASRAHSHDRQRANRADWDGHTVRRVTLLITARSEAIVQSVHGGSWTWRRQPRQARAAFAGRSRFCSRVPLFDSPAAANASECPCVGQPTRDRHSYLASVPRRIEAAFDRAETCPPTVVSQISAIAELCDVQKLLLPHPALSTQPFGPYSTFAV